MKIRMTGDMAISVSTLFLYGLLMIGWAGCDKAWRDAPAPNHMGEFRVRPDNMRRAHERRTAFVGQDEQVCR
jgi:hypothetical protein